MNAHSPLTRRQWVLTVAAGVVLPGCGGGASGPSPLAPSPADPPPAVGTAWSTFGGNAQHTGVSSIATQALNRIQWTTPVDLDPEYRSGNLLSHYGSPLITARNTVIVPVKTGRTGGFKVEGRTGASGALVWTQDSDYILPAHAWTPSFNPVLTPSNRLVAPAAGGKLRVREDADSATSTTRDLVFFGEALYNANRAVFDATVFVNTPVTSDANGALYFGFIVTGANPANLTSGIARVSSEGTGTWVSAKAISAELIVDKVAMNCAPALSADGATLYVAVNTTPIGGTRASGFLLALQASNLALRHKIQLLDPATGTPAWVNDNSTASPTVAPDGRVYYGVLEANPPAHNFRGWMLQFDATLNPSGVAGAFGWDDTASIVPASLVPAYSGNSNYLLMVKYNNYGGVGSGDGLNRIAILDPSNSQADTLSTRQVMREVLTIVGPTADPGYPGGVREWCINTAAVDPFTKSVLVNNEDGYLYRWDLSTNRFSERIQLTSGLGEAYTPTAIGPTGSVFAVNNAILFSIGR